MLTKNRWQNAYTYLHAYVRIAMRVHVYTEKHVCLVSYIVAVWYCGKNVFFITQTIN